MPPHGIPSCVDRLDKETSDCTAVIGAMRHFQPCPGDEQLEGVSLATSGYPLPQCHLGRSTIHFARRRGGVPICSSGSDSYCQELALHGTLADYASLPLYTESRGVGTMVPERACGFRGTRYAVPHLHGIPHLPRHFYSSSTKSCPLL